MVVAIFATDAQIHKSVCPDSPTLMQHPVPAEEKGASSVAASGPDNSKGAASPDHAAQQSDAGQPSSLREPLRNLATRPRQSQRENTIDSDVAAETEHERSFRKLPPRIIHR